MRTHRMISGALFAATSLLSIGLGWTAILSLNAFSHQAVTPAKIAATQGGLFAILGTGLVVSGVLGYWMGKYVLDGLKQFQRAYSALAEGDLVSRTNFARRDDLGNVLRVVENAADEFHHLLVKVSQHSERLNFTSQGLSDLVANLNQSTLMIDEKAHTLVHSADQLSVDMTSISTSAEETSSNTHLVATGADEMTITVSGIAQNAEKARQYTVKAVDCVSNAVNRVDQLEQAALEINQIIGMIVELAEQTKLLALNATIEAARAGETGKGFAVVASEVKDLAKQTGEASEMIRSKIEGVRTTTQEAVSKISNIKSVIDRVNELISSIVYVAEEQTISTREISQNVAQAADNVKRISTSISQNAGATQRIVGEIHSTTAIKREIDAYSDRVQAMSGEYQDLSAGLMQELRSFRI